MRDQSDLVVALAEFQPKLVKMDAGKSSSRKRRSKPRKKERRKDPRRR